MYAQSQKNQRNTEIIKKNKLNTKFEKLYSVDFNQNFCFFKAKF